MFEVAQWSAEVSDQLPLDLFSCLCGHRLAFCVLNILSVYIVLGIGVDDCYVFLDAFQQSRNARNMEQAFGAAFNRSARAMFITSFTTALAFLANMVSSIPVVFSFAVFMATLVFLNFIFTITIFVAMVAVWHEYVEAKEQLLWKKAKATIPCLEKLADRLQPATVDEAREAETRFSGFVDHPFPGCYVCGPDRDDGLRLFPGWLDDRRAVACPWTPAASHGDDRGRVTLPQVYAALDCPGSFTLEKDPDTWVVLGSFTVQVDALPNVGETYVVSGWPLGRDGRKHFAGTAVHDAAGRCLARAHAVWVQIPAGSR